MKSLQFLFRKWSGLWENRHIQLLLLHKPRKKYPPDQKSYLTCRFLSLFSKTIGIFVALLMVPLKYVLKCNTHEQQVETTEGKVVFMLTFSLIFFHCQYVQVQQLHTVTLDSSKLYTYSQVLLSDNKEQTLNIYPCEYYVCLDDDSSHCLLAQAQG